MTKIYFIRHAQSHGNAERIFQGQTDTPLTDEGFRQAGLVAQRMQNVHLDAIYSSPLNRAWDTAAAIASVKNMQVIPCPGLIEINVGAFQGRPFDELKKEYPTEFYQFTDEPHKFMGVGGGESMLEVYERMRRTVRELSESHAGGAIAVVTHGAAVRCYLCYAMGLTLERIVEVPWMPNTGVAKIVYYEDFRPAIQYIGDDSHLTERKDFALF